MTAETGLPTPLKVNTDILRDVSQLKKATKIVNTSHKSQPYKQMCLEHGDHGDPLLFPEIEPVGKEKPAELSAAHVMLGLTQLVMS